MALFNVFLDTNVFMNAKYDFNHGALLNLKKHCNNGTAVLFTNSIIVREVQHHIDSDVGLMASQAKNTIKDHGELVNALSQAVYQEIKSIILTAPSKLATEFASYIAGATELSNDGLSMVSLFDDYFSNNAPFENKKEKKSEFPDAVAIMSIKRYMLENKSDTLHVVTNDNGWHAALKGVEGIVLHKDLKALLTQISKEEEIYVQIAQYMGDCIECLQASISNWFYEQDWSSLADDIDSCIECDEIDEITISAVKLVPDGIEYIDRDGDYASAAFSGIATIQLGFQYTDHTNEVYDREDHAWCNTVYGHGSAEITVPFTGSVTILISDDGEMELNSPDFDEVNLGEIEIVDYELTPHCEDDEPFFDTCPDCGRPIGIHNDGGNGFCVDCASHH